MIRISHSFLRVQHIPIKSTVIMLVNKTWYYLDIHRKQELLSVQDSDVTDVAKPCICTEKTVSQYSLIYPGHFILCQSMLVFRLTFRTTKNQTEDSSYSTKPFNISAQYMMKTISASKTSNISLKKEKKMIINLYLTALTFYIVRFKICKISDYPWRNIILP